jgi:hypothetical protein
MNQGEPAIVPGKKKHKRKKKQQQQHSWRGARGAHEKDLMFFLAGEYDAGASFHLSKRANMKTHNGGREMHLPSHFF